jgi:hypothetical protein
MNKIKKALREGGVGLLVKRVCRHIYLNYLRKFMPVRWGEYGGVRAPTVRLFEDVLDLKELNKSSYEPGMVSAFEEYAKPGETLTILGGGVGVTAVKAASKLDPNKITIYEGSEEYYNRIKRTLEFHDFEDIEVINAIVETGENLFGEEGASRQISAKDLSECDILEIDVEGNEIPILQSLEIKPRIILVESHGMFGSPTEEVKKTLESIGYEIADIREAEQNKSEQDLKVIVGKVRSREHKGEK